jgi:hypothetical protein
VVAVLRCFCVSCSWPNSLWNKWDIASTPPFWEFSKTIDIWDISEHTCSSSPGFKREFFDLFRHRQIRLSRQACVMLEASIEREDEASTVLLPAMVA